MNSFGSLYRVQVFGESHGAGVGVLIDGCPAGLPVDAQFFEEDLARRRGGRAGTTPRREPDEPVILAGVFEGRTTGTPILIRFENRDVDSSSYDSLRKIPRPGHADFVAEKKYGGFHDHRGGGHFSGRLTAGLVAAGVIARRLIEPIRIQARLMEAGGSADVERIVEAAMTEGDSVGGIVECRAAEVSVGLGEPFFDSVESLISHLAFSIGGVRGIEFGSGFGCARMRGSECNDVLIDEGGRTETNHAGGVNGGLSNGNELVYRVAIKPTSSIARSQKTVDLRSGEPVELKVEGRHDACIALRIPVILEAATAIVLADLLMLEQRIPRVLES